MADRIFHLSKEMAHKRLKSSDFLLACTIIRQTLGITDEVWSAMVVHMNKKVNHGPIIITGDS